MFNVLFNSLRKMPFRHVNVLDAGFKGDPKLQEMTEQAKRKMAEWGRVPVLEGGEFQQNNVILDRPGHRRLT